MGLDEIESSPVEIWKGPDAYVSDPYFSGPQLAEGRNPMYLYVRRNRFFKQWVTRPIDELGRHT
jgi:hypothetical protein